MERFPRALGALLLGLRAVQRGVAPLGHLLLVLALIALPALGTASPTAGRPDRASAARHRGHPPLVVRSACAGATLAAVPDRELDEEGSDPVEQPTRFLGLDDDGPSRELVTAVDETPACLVRLLAFPIRGPPSA